VPGRRRVHLPEGPWAQRPDVAAIKPIRGMRALRQSRPQITNHESVSLPRPPAPRLPETGPAPLVTVRAAQQRAGVAVAQWEPAQGLGLEWEPAWGVELQPEQVQEQVEAAAELEPQQEPAPAASGHFRSGPRSSDGRTNCGRFLQRALEFD
jgi:hypothetical protein